MLNVKSSSFLSFDHAIKNKPNMNKLVVIVLIISF